MHDQLMRCEEGCVRVDKQSHTSSEECLLKSSCLSEQPGHSAKKNEHEVRCERLLHRYR